MERLYHYLWQSRMFGKSFRDNTGCMVEVIDPGSHNNDSGPDFFNSKVKIDGTEWVGNVEIHVKASDWYRHGHQNDIAYDNIILHVVGVADKEVQRRDGSVIPQIEITFPEKFFNTLSMLSEEMDEIRCGSILKTLSPLQITDWLESLSVERLQDKAQHVLDIFNQTSGDWEQTCFIILARSLGFGVNSVPFEMLAKSLPLNFVHRHSDNTLQIEALLFGQAGMLDSSLHIFDDYYQNLCREYYFLARKYSLRPLNPGLWKYSRTRPQNFPHRRIAMLAKACENGFSLFSKIIESKMDADLIKEHFKWELEGYWHSHFSFDVEAKKISDSLSETSLNLLMINLVAPLVYSYSSQTGDIERAEKVFGLLESLPAENNTIVGQWKSLGIPVKDAQYSQAVLHLKKNYCDTRKCLYCRFGNHFLRVSSET